MQTCWMHDLFGISEFLVCVVLTQIRETHGRSPEEHRGGAGDVLKAPLR